MSVANLVEIFAETIQGEGRFIGRKEILIRFHGCPLHCKWCDTRYSRQQPPKVVPIIQSNHQIIDRISNPVTFENLAEWILNQWDDSFHCVSLTGGEPLEHTSFIKNLIEKTEEKGIKYHLESAGFPSDRFKEIVPYITYPKVDFKPSDSLAHLQIQELWNAEIQCLEYAQEINRAISLKIVLTDETPFGDIRWLRDQLNKRLEPEFQKLKLWITLQPVTPIKNARAISQPPTIAQMLKFHKILIEKGRILSEHIQITPQIHLLLNAP